MFEVIYQFIVAALWWDLLDGYGKTHEIKYFLGSCLILLTSIGFHVMNRYFDEKDYKKELMEELKKEGKLVENLLP